MIKPTFLTKKQREELAAQEALEDKKKAEQKKKDEAVAHDRFITGKNLEEKLKQERLKREKEEKERIERQKEEKKDSKEHDHEIECIREHYLGSGENRHKQAKPSERATRVFQFEWKDSDDTGKNDLNPLYNNRIQINALFGRGYIAGVDQKEQRKESNFLGSLSQKRLGEVNGNGAALTEEERRQREMQIQRLNADLNNNKRYHDGNMKNSHDCHWSEKPLSAMNERDWRIFREDFDIRIKNGKAVNPLRNWQEANFPREIMQAIEVLGYKEPSPIQRQAIPVGLISGDIIGIAETGSGKTAAFLIPLLCYLLKMDPKFIKRCDMEGPLAIVMAPTRELAQQIYDQCILLAQFTQLRATFVVGGQNIEEQGFILRQGVEIVVGTPGRMVDCIGSNYLVLNQCNYVVLDEADRMVDMGFEPQVLEVLDAMGGLLKSEDEHLLEQQLQSAQKGEQVYRVTAMFSATMPTQVEKIAKTYLRHPVMVRIGDEESGKNKRIEQRVLFIAEGQKKSKLSECMQKLTSSDKTIIFVNSKKQSDTIGWNLENAGHRVGILHGGKSQDQREEVLEMFRNSQITVLVATDIAGRGLDIPDVTNVINYDCPNQIENYCHRIGRTGRAGKFGVATSFLTEEDTDIMFDLKTYLESTNSVVPLQLQKHPAAQAPVGARDEKGKLVSAKKDSVMYASR